MKLIRNADVYAPEHLGLRDILIEGEKIARVEADLSRYESLADAVYDLRGAVAVPGYIDGHIHITGGGGEQGPASRVPECPLSALTVNGVTTVLGLLGTDGTSRSLPNLLYKCRALNEEGVTCYMLTGSYQYPSPVMTGSVIDDIALIDRVIGCKIALSDHRSSNLTKQELIRLASDVRMGGLISGKAGVLVMHMGSGTNRLRHVLDAVRETDIPVRTFWPTHMRRSPELIDEGVALIELGGTIDFTATEDGGVAETVADLVLRRGVSVDHITMSSDAFGSQPRFDEKGNCVGLTYVSPKTLHMELKRMVQAHGMPLESALKLLTVNPARMMQLTGEKGEIAPGADADLIAYGPDMEIDAVFARGVLAVQGGKAVLKGRFE
ncbi:MAG: beta-aspartyl-peptidase [Clostridia bacterium]|nr:beta-aspartyl-peptidase [Clostridia bacterium]